MGDNMKNLQNLHTHTTYCDGKDTPEEMIKYARDKGFESIGFSGHSHNSYSPYVKITAETTEKYKEEIKALKGKYKDIFPIFLGLEVDMYSGIDLSGYDYLIGAMHYLKKGDRYLGFDTSAERVKALIDENFGGDGMCFAKEYYRQLATLSQYGNFDIIAHFDIISKNLDKIPFFDEYSEEYIKMAVEAMTALKGKIPFFELNTGGIARGYRKMPYPSVPLLKELKRLGFSAVISSDCHDGSHIDCFFEEGRELLRECGFNERYILTESGFTAVEI